MGITKSEIFTTEQNQLALLAKTLGHPARIAILQHLFSMNDCVCGHLVEEIGLAQATISQHLTALKTPPIIFFDEKSLASLYRKSRFDFALQFKSIEYIYNERGAEQDISTSKST